MTTSANTSCPYCNAPHLGVCPLLKAIEYNPDGSVRRVEFKTQADWHQQTDQLAGRPQVFPPYRGNY